MLARAGEILGVAAVVAALVGCGGSKSSATATNTPSATQSAKTQCSHVGQGATKLLAGGLNSGKRLSSTVYAVPSGDEKTPWVFAARIGSAGVAEWATDLTPTTPANTKAAHFIQAANSVAWNDSQWGVLGSFPKNYPSPPAVPSLDDPAFSRAAACFG
jgi:hypothetical protein